MPEVLVTSRRSWPQASHDAPRQWLAGAALGGLIVGLSRLAPREESPQALRATSPSTLTRTLWPPILLAFTLSGLRLWNAPASQRRARALLLWSAAQGLSAIWMAASARARPARLVALIAGAGVGLAYANEARRIEAPAHDLAGPYLSWMGFANILDSGLGRRMRATIH